MAKAKKVATKKPSGLTITRNGNKFTFQWKIADVDYGEGQQLQYHLSNMKKDAWTSISVGNTTITKTLTIDPAKYYPTTKTMLESITFRVRGRRKNYTITKGSGKNKKTTEYDPNWSDWTSKVINLSVPNVPSLRTTWEAEHNNQTVFTWNTTTATDGVKHFVNVELQSILIKDCNETDGSKLPWKSTTLGWITQVYSANNSRTITENTVLIANASHTRWVRVRSRGARGASAWRYAKHVYGKPYQAKVKSASAKKTNALGYNCDIIWEVGQPASHPIDTTTVGYYIGTPNNGLACPSGVNFTPASTSKDTSGKDKANFEVDNQVDLDQCMWLRVDTKHDDRETIGVPQRVAVGRLKNPTSIDATVPASGYTATITAQNASTVPDSFLVIVYRRKNKSDLIVGIIPHGQTETTVTCPNWSQETTFSFGAYAAQGKYSRVSRTDSVTQYSVTTNTTSQQTIWTVDDVPKAPRTVTLSEGAENGTIQVNWEWSWGSATGAEIAWSDDKNAWESTAGYNSYKLESRAAKWYIPGLEMGKKWYVRVRLSDAEQDGPWSRIETIDLATTPSTPVLTASAGRITENSNVTLSWTYETRDGTPQAFAEIKECTINGDTITYGRTIGHTSSTQGLIIYPEIVGWEAGQSYNLTVRVTSGSGKKSSWSDPISVEVAELPICEIVSTSLQEVTIIDDEEQGITSTVLALTEMPLSIIVSGAGDGGLTSVYIERAESYHMDRPDETDFNGHEGEDVVIYKQDGEEPITITQENLIGYLDDGAKYRIIAITEDELGQIAEERLNFEVRWAHQAVIPTATVVADNTEHIVKITPVQPEGYAQGDVCDIYRLSVDKPELIIQDGVWGETYVDPYPTLNEHGGHRVVFKTKNGDYITETNQPAWTDYTDAEDDIINLDSVVIDCNGEHILLPYNIALSSSWRKDFTETKYLGGSIQGDWNKAVSRNTSINTTSVVTEDPYTIKQMRKLASFPGICHVRTPEGSSFAADVQVSESMSSDLAGKIANFSLSITKVDPEGLDGMTLAEWEEEQ